MNKILIYLLIVCIIPHCSTKQSNQRTIIIQKQGLNNFIIEDPKYWTQVNPQSFLDSLKKYPNSVFCIATKPKKSWFDQKVLFSIQKDTVNPMPAAIVYSMSESNLHTSEMHSTVSIQAKFIIEGYIKQDYPPTLCSFHYFK